MLDHYYYRPAVGADTPYADLVASLGAIAYWPLQDTTGTDTIGGYNLSWSSTPAAGTGPGGELTAALDFESASDQWGSVTNAALRPTEALSLIAWVNAESLAADYGIIACGDTSTYGYRLTGGSGTGITVQIRDGVSTNAYVAGATSLSTATWYFVAATYDKTNLRLYFNATQDGNSPTAATFSIGYSGQTLYVGNWDGNSARDWDGLLAGVAVFGTALSGANITALYDAVL